MKGTALALWIPSYIYDYVKLYFKNQRHICTYENKLYTYMWHHASHQTCLVGGMG